MALLLSANLLDSREGRAIRALRGGRIMAESLGIDPFRIKLATFVIAALLSALSGWLYAHMSRFVSPAPFDVNVGILYLLMAMVGGMAHLSGAVVGAAIVTLLKNGIQDYLPMIASGASGAARGRGLLGAVHPVAATRARRPGAVRAALPAAPAAFRAARGGLTRPSPSTRTRPAPFDRGRRHAPLRRAGRRRRRELRAPGRGDPGPDRAERRRQDHDVQPHHRRAASHQGRIGFLGKDITGRAQRQIARAGIARTFQHVKLRKTMTLLDTVLLGTYGRTSSGFFAGALRLDRAEEARARAEAM